MVVLLSLLALAPARGAGRAKETLELSFGQVRARTNGPMLTEVKLTWTGRSLLEGRLELALKSGGELLTTCRTPELALTTGEQRFDLLLPSVTTATYDSRIDVHARFLTPRKTFDFPATQWFLPRATERGCVVCVCQDRLAWNEVVAAVARTLRLEAFRPKPEGRPTSTLATASRHTEPDEMPTQPIAYCAFDVVLLMGRGFGFLKAPQLDALARWTRAGGSVCVVAEGGLEPRHAKFLNALAERPAFRLDIEGRLRPIDAEAEDDGIHTFHACLGRLAVITRPPEKPADVETPGWRRASAFLWKVRKAQLEAVLGPRGKWRTDLQRLDVYTERAVTYAGRGGSARQAEVVVYPLAFCSVNRMLDALMPKRVRVMPFGVVVLILVLFGACVGPLDYWLLGRLRRRKLTWVVFPLTAVAFTWFTVRLAEHYMGLEDHRRAIVFVDLDSRGQPVRQSRYQFIFTAGERTERFDVRNALFYTMGRGDGMTGPQAYGGGYTPAPARPPGDTEPLRYEGRLPSRYIVCQRISRWTPYLNKAFSLDPPERVPAFDWNAPALRDVSIAGRQELQRALSHMLRRPSAAYLFHGQRMNKLVGWGAFPVLTQDDRSPATGPHSLLQVACVRPQVGLFSIVSQVSPTGAPDFEDLAILDPTDERQWLLVIIEQDGDDIYVYRRLYREEG